jgi:hypothetical protein
MAEKVQKEGFLVVPSLHPDLPESFQNFLWDQEVSAMICLLTDTWVRMPESGETGLGLRVAPGSC